MVDIPKELAKDISQKNIVLFIGNKVSELAGIPPLSKVVAPLAQAIKYPMPATPEYITSEHILKAIERYENKFGRNELIKYIRQALDITHLSTSNVLKRLLSIPFNVILTTNYDTLIEQGLRELKTPFDVVRNGKQLIYTSNDRVKVIKLKGDIYDPSSDSLILNYSEHLQYSQRQPLLSQYLSTLLANSTFLFVGFDLSDPSFLLVYNGILYDLQQHQRPAYFVIHDRDNMLAEDLKFKGVYPLNIGNIATDFETALESWLLELEDILSRETKNLLKKQSNDQAPSRISLIDEVKELLISMGFTIKLDENQTDQRRFSSSRVSLGEEIRRHFLCAENIVVKSDVEDLLIDCENDSGSTAWIVTYNLGTVAEGANDIAQSNDKVNICSLGMFYSRMMGFHEYLGKIITEYSNSEIPSFWVNLSCDVPRYNSTRDTIVSKDVYSNVEYYLDAWLDSPTDNHISVLGDFGTGKTWLCKKYAAKAAQKFLSNPENHRIPILVSLREYTKSLEIEQLVTDAIVNNGADLPGGFSTFNCLNKNGKLLLILDGFDEMEQRVDFFTKVKNFEELARLVLPKSKVILTSRTSYFRSNIEEQDILGEHRHQIDLKSRPNFDVIYLQEFDNEKIQEALQKRVGDNYLEYWELISNIYDLVNLAQRPIMLDMMAETLPEIKDQKEVVDPVLLYSIYTKKWITKDIESDRTILNENDKLEFVLDLALEMFSTNRYSINFREMPQIIKEHFLYKVGTSGKTRLDYLDNDVRTCSFLVRDSFGNYKFAHRSFYEFFIAQKIVQSIKKGEKSILDQRYLSEHIAAFVTKLLKKGDITYLKDMINECLPSQETCRAQAIYYYATLAGQDGIAFLQEFTQKNSGDPSYLMSLQIAYHWLARLGDKDSVSKLILLFENNPQFRREFLEYLLYYFGSIENLISGTYKRYQMGNYTSILAPFGDYLLDLIKREFGKEG